MTPGSPEGGSSSDPLHDLLLLIRSRYGLIELRTVEEERAISLLRHLADRLHIPLFRWTRVHGLGRDGLDNVLYDTQDPAKALDNVRASGLGGVYHFHGLGPEIAKDPDVSDRLAEAARKLETVDGALVLTGENLELPPALQRRSATVDLPGPGPADFGRLLDRITRDMGARGHVDVDLTPDERASLLHQLSGLTLMEAQKILTKAVVEDGRITARDIRYVADAKKEIVEKQGLLEYYPAEVGLTEIADLKTLKAWLAKRKAVVAAPERAQEFGLAFPRGMLLLGVPGCGKSLSAKAVAREWTLPLLKLDPSNLYNKYVGQSEQNFKRAMGTAERVAPVVLWIDELEKAFAAGGGEDGGVSERILGSLLSWMQDRKGDVFVVATANEIDRLPPEFLRKGRFDEIFFVDLPDPETRAQIFRIHLKSRKQDPSSFDLDALATDADGFSGAEIEEVVVSALYTAFTDGGTLTQAILEGEVRSTRPLSVTMAEKVARIRAWADGRAVRAN